MARQRFIFYTQKNSIRFLAYPKKTYTSTVNYGVLTMKSTIPPKKSLCFFFKTQKIHASFIDPKKSLLAKMGDPKKSLRPPVSKMCEWGPWVMQILNKNLLQNLPRTVYGFLTLSQEQGIILKLFLVRNRVRLLGSQQHIPTVKFGEYPLGLHTCSKVR